MSEWISCEFGSLYAEPSRNGLTKPKRVRGHGVKFVNMGEIFQYDRLKNFQCDRVPLSENEKFALLKNDDLLIARQSLVLAGAGKCSIFLGDFEEVAFESHIIRVRLDQTKANPLFYYYLFRSPQGRALIEAIVEQGAGASGVRSSDLQSLMIPYPSLPQQKAIARILGSLDDKIELNRRMNETLEAMARAIFKDWFVDFGPTRAKIEGRAPYLPEPIWSLFPDAIDPQSGLPQGWESSKLEDFMELAYGKSLTAKNRLPGDVVVYGSGGETGFHNEALISSPAVIVGRKGTVGSIYWEDRPIFPIDTVFYVVPKKTSLFFCYQLLLTQPLANMNTDAAVPGLNRNNAYRLEFPYPGSDLLNAYELITSPIWAQRSVNIKESRTLAELRDRLLPKLMSGQIRVKDAEKLVEEVL